MDEPTPNPLERLSPVQQGLLAEWLGPFRVVQDHSWPLQTTVVVELESAQGRCIAKASAGRLMDKHSIREIQAHTELLPGLGEGFPELLHADTTARLLVTKHLPGAIAKGTEWQWHPGVHRAAGSLLARLHDTSTGDLSDDYLPKAIAKTRKLLESSRDLIDPETWSTTVDVLEHTHPEPVALVATHGDFQPNWLIDPNRPDADGTPHTTLIDFGRFEYRPWYSDLVRLHHSEFRERPELAASFFDGAGWSFTYPVPPHESSGWLVENLLQAVGAIVWSTWIGDHRFTAEGHAMLGHTLAGLACN